jgi:uncharacterized membrane protein
MNIMLALVGALIGGTIWHFGGAVAGAIVGWLCGRVNELGQEQVSFRRELARLQERRDGAKESCREGERAAAPFSAEAAGVPVRTQSIVELSVDDMVPEVREPLLRPPAGERPQSVRAAVGSPGSRVGTVAADQPSPVADWLQQLFSGGNLLVKVGVVILLFGVSFLVKYAAQRGLLPVQLRLAGAAMGGLVLLVLGWRLRHQRREYALTLQGGGIGILYITVFAAYRICHLIPAGPAFALLTLVVAACGWLAVGQNARTLALFGLAGGFLAPLLCGVGNGNPALLFGYYALLNAGIAGIAWFRSWRALNLAGFIATFVVSLLWGSVYYRPQWFATVEPFLAYSFLLYVAVATLFALRQPPELRGAVDGTLVFGTPIAAFLLQALLVHDYRYGLAWSALVAGLVYLVLWALLRRRDEALQPLVDAYLAFGALFVTLSVPLAFDGRWTAAVWAMEGAGVVWAGSRQKRPVTTVFGVILQLAAGIAFLKDFGRPSGLLPIANAICLGMLLLCLAGLVTARALQRVGDDRQEWQQWTGQGMAVWGLIWWFSGGLHEIHTFMAPELVAATWLLFLSLSCWGWHLAGRRLDWNDLGVPALLLVPLLAISAVAAAPAHPFDDGGWLAWPLALASAWALLRLREEDAGETLKPWLHSGALWLAVWLATRELGWQLQQLLPGKGDWQFIGLMLPALAALALVTVASSGSCWPVGRHRAAYLGLASLPLVAGVWMWTLVAAGLPGDGWPLAWLPILNPLDLAVLATLAILWHWRQRLQTLPELAGIAGAIAAPLEIAFAASAFLWLNMLLARTLHHWGDVPYGLDALVHSSMAQTAFAVFWTLLALGAMFVACRSASRGLWLGGAALLALVVLKLFIFDLGGHGTVERIVSFVAVGLLLLVIGWLAPVPPGKGPGDGDTLAAEGAAVGRKDRPLSGSC